MSSVAPSNADTSHCTLLHAIEADAGSVSKPFRRHVVDGAALSASTQLMQCDETVEVQASLLGEELAAVLEGRVDVVAADEHYVLSAGEAILIPPHEARRYRCITPRCVLYRVTCGAQQNGAVQV